jgi:hypothetical protein
VLLEAGRHAGRSKPAVAACFGAHAQEEWAFAAVHLCVGVVFLLLAAPLAVYTSSAQAPEDWRPARELTNKMQLYQV